MLNFEEELKKFRPSPDVKNAEEAIKNEDLTDVIDLIREFSGELSVSAGTDVKKERDL